MEGLRALHSRPGSLRGLAEVRCRSEVGAQKRPRSEQEAGAAYLPRPALGRRPWLALFRRARSLRRFALAITRGRVTGIIPLHTLAIRLTDGGWQSGPLLVVAGFLQRLRGMRGVPPGWGVLLRTGSVHTFGMSQSLMVLSLDGSGRILRRGTVPPGRVVSDRGAVWMAEMPPGRCPPKPGRVVHVLPMLAGWPHP